MERITALITTASPLRCITRSNLLRALAAVRHRRPKEVARVARKVAVEVAEVAEVPGVEAAVAGLPQVKGLALSFLPKRSLAARTRIVRTARGA